MRTLLILGIAVSFAASASAFTMIDFDGFADGTPVGEDFGGYGVTFWDDGTNMLTVNDAYPGDPFSSPNSVYNYNQGGYGWHYYARFLGLPANLVTVVMGDYGADAEYLYLEAYDSGDNLVASDNDYISGSEYGKVLEVAAGEIAWVKFYSEGDYSGSVLFDNFGFELVPEPATVSLIGFGVLGLTGLLKRRF